MKAYATKAAATTAAHRFLKKEYGSGYMASTGDGRKVATCSEKIARQFLNAAQASGRLAALYRIDHTSGSVTQIDGD